MIFEMLDFFFVALASMVIIINPITSAFMFVSLLPFASNYEKRLVARKSVIISISILLFFLVTGSYFFSLFGITIGAFRIAGGLLLFGIAMNMINKSKGEHDHHKPQHIDTDDIALIPLAIPFLSGPGSIATVVLLTTQARSVWDLVLLGFVIVAVLIGCFYAMFYSDRLVRYVGVTGRKILTKIFGLILAVISIQFIVDGILDLLPEAVEVVEVQSEALENNETLEEELPV